MTMIADLRLRISDWRQRITRLLRRAVNSKLAIRNLQWSRGHHFLTGRSGDMVEGALTFPLMALVALALVNLALAGYASTTANHAAGYGARAGSVAQVDPAARALEAAQHALASGVGTYNVRVAADTYPGGVVRVEVDWAVPNFYGSLMPLFGASGGPLDGTSVSAFRKEGW
jgi:Flp pilus assembly protein TadG